MYKNQCLSIYCIYHTVIVPTLQKYKTVITHTAVVLQSGNGFYREAEAMVCASKQVNNHTLIFHVDY